MKQALRREQGVSPPAEVVAAVRQMVDDSSQAGAAGALGIGVVTVVRLCAGAPVRPGTIALVQQRLAERRTGAAS